jgi:hypothetical protein
MLLRACEKKAPRNSQHFIEPILQIKEPERKEEESGHGVLAATLQLLAAATCINNCDG